MSESGSPFFLDEEIKRMRADMDESVLFMGLVNPKWLDDPTCWMQLGYMLMKGKPIVLLVQKGTVSRARARRCAHRRVGERRRREASHDANPER